MNICSLLILLSIVLLTTNNNIYIEVSKSLSKKQIKIGGYSIKGRREYMEDYYFMREYSDYGLYFVCDGHVGKETSFYIKKFMPIYIAYEFKKLKKRNKTTSKSDIKKIIYTCCLRIEKEILSQPHNAGSTLIMIFVVKKQAYIVNIGDSRCVVYNKNNKSIKDLSNDHKPNRIDEHARIKSNGGVIFFDGFTHRVHYDVGASGLAMSRAIGDKSYKLISQVVSAVPEIITHTIQKDDLFIIASDGLWDVIDNKFLKSFLNTNLDENEYTKTATKLVKIAYDKGSGDNITTLLIQY